MSRTAALAVLALPLGAAAGSFEGPLWDDGKAEVALYDAREVRYGRTIDTSAVFIAVKEDLDPLTLVKADRPGPASIPVIKSMRVVEVPTGIYTYHQLLSAFLGRADLTLLKLTVGSQEWCGNTYLAWRRRGQRLELRGESYFDGEAAVEGNVAASVLFVDVLPHWLRGQDLTRPREVVVDLVPTQIGNRVKAPTATRAVMRYLGATGKGLEVALAAADGEHRLVFDAAAPHAMASWRRPDGSGYERRRLERLAYWEMSGEGFRDYLRRPATP